jgi:hypothetical protein
MCRDVAQANTPNESDQLTFTSYVGLFLVFLFFLVCAWLLYFLREWRYVSANAMWRSGKKLMQALGSWHVTKA